MFQQESIDFSDVNESAVTIKMINSKVSAASLAFLNFTDNTEVVLCGCAGVGKTSLLRRISGGSIICPPTTTQGVEVFNTNLEVAGRLQSEQLWDGPEAGKPNAYFEANMALVVFSVTDRNSLDSIGELFVKLRSYSGPHVSLLLVGTKSDLEGQRQVPYDVAQEFADKNYMPYVKPRPSH